MTGNFKDMALFACGCAILMSGCGNSKIVDGVSKAESISSKPNVAVSAASSKAATDENSVCLFKDDFESEQSPFFGHLGDSARITIVSGGDAISGKRSLCMDAIGSNSEWICLAELSKNLHLTPGKAYSVKFKYRILETANQSADNFISAAGKGEGNFYGRTMYASAPGQSGSADFLFILPENSEGAVIRFSSHGASRTVIDDVEIRRFNANLSSWLFKPNAFIGMRKTPTNPNMLDLSNPAYALPREKYFPMVDEFGQFKHAEWDGKVHSEKELKGSVETEKLYNASRKDIPDRDEFGGLADSAKGYSKTEGFTTAKVGGKWYLRDPDGNLFWSVGATCVGNFPETTVTDREFYFDEIDPAYVSSSIGYKPGSYYHGRKVKSCNFGLKNFERKYGNGADYGKIASTRFKKWGMNTYGAWSSLPVLKSADVPFTAYISSKGAKPLETKRKLYVLWGAIPDYFDPSFETETIKSAEKSAAILNSKYCIGAFVDNEISWQRKLGDTALAVIKCPASQPAKIEMQKMLVEKYADISALNKAWKSGYSSWDEFLSKPDFEPKFEDAERDLLAFEKLFCERYFKVCRKAVKTASSKALYLGCRLASRNEIVEKASFKICDVVSYNIYKTSLDSFAPPSGAKDKPVIIGEFHIGRIDKGSPYGGLLEAPNAEAAAAAYKKYMISALKNPHIVGAHWFQWFDCMFTGRGDDANATCGFVSVTDTPDYALADACREVSSEMYKIRSEK